MLSCVGIVRGRYWRELSGFSVSAVRDFRPFFRCENKSVPFFPDTKVETLTIDAIKAELDFIDLQLKRKNG